MGPGGGGGQEEECNSAQIPIKQRCADMHFVSV
jgi:hypothetical protein